MGEVTLFRDPIAVLAVAVYLVALGVVYVTRPFPGADFGLFVMFALIALVSIMSWRAYVRGIWFKGSAKTQRP